MTTSPVAQPAIVPVTMRSIVTAADPSPRRSWSPGLLGSDQERLKGEVNTVGPLVDPLRQSKLPSAKPKPAPRTSSLIHTEQEVKTCLNRLL